MTGGPTPQDAITVTPIGHVRSTRVEATDDYWGGAVSRIELDAGIFAQRSKRRPNRLGLTRCRLLRIEGVTLFVEGLDAIDGTPVLDIKPYLREFDPRGEVRQPAWSTEVMEKYFAPDPGAPAAEP